MSGAGALRVVPQPADAPTVMQKEPSRSSDHLMDVNALFDAAPEALLVPFTEQLVQLEAPRSSLSRGRRTNGER